MITQERLKEELRYVPETGEFFWLTTKSGRTNVLAGYKNADGRRVIRLDYRHYYGYRLAFLYMTGVYPIDQVDHINLDPADDRWCNLRLCTRSQNAQNRKANHNNSLGKKNIVKVPTGYWVKVQCGGVKHIRGPIQDIVEAEEVARNLRMEVHGEFRNA